MRTSRISAGGEKRFYIMDIFVCLLVCMVHNSIAKSLPRHQENRRTVKLVPNSFQVFVQQSRPTSLPHAPKVARKAYKIPVGGIDYQSDQGYMLPWPVEQPITEDERNSPEESCKLSCEYGYEADIEGNELCKCKDPCKGVKCFGGSKCEPKRECVFDQCEYTAVCKAPEDVCSLPKPKYTFICEKLSKRYYFDTKRGLCRKFWGCAEISANSFDNKKACKSACYSKEHKQRDRKTRQHKNSGSNERLSAQVSSEVGETEMSNVIPTYKEVPSISNLLSEGLEEKNNHIESNHKQPPYSDIFSQQVPGLNQLNGCPSDSQYEPCPFDPCGGCSGSSIMCFTSFCGKCQAIYIDLQTGEASDKFAAQC